MAQPALRAWLRGLAPPPEGGPARRYLFHHMPKTGGTSLQAIFRDWFHVIGDYRAPWSARRPKPLALATLGPDDLLAGHFASDGMPLARRYPETADPARWRRIAFVRDPLDLALSVYFYERTHRAAHDPAFRSPGLGAFLRAWPGLYLAHFECTRETWREVLEGYWFIGTFERLPACVAWLSAAMGKPPPEAIPHRNSTPRDETPDPEDLAVFCANMALEFEIYRWVSRRLRLTLGEQPLDEIAG
jgi:hypothetical protein